MTETLRLGHGLTSLQNFSGTIAVSEQTFLTRLLIGWWKVAIQSGAKLEKKSFIDNDLSGISDNNTSSSLASIHQSSI